MSSPPTSELLSAYHAPSDWLGGVIEYSAMDRAVFADYMACFFREQFPQEDLDLPPWAEDARSATYAQGRARDLSVVIHSELMARDPYKVPIHEGWIEALEGRAEAGFEILDIGAGTSSYCELARRLHPGVRAVLAEVHPGLCEYLRWKYRGDDTVRVVLLETIAPKITTQHRVHIDLSPIPGGADAIVLGDVLEHSLDPLGMLLELRRKLRPNGLWMIAFASYIEGDWHTPEAYYLRPWCLRLLTRVARRINKHCWQGRSGAKVSLTARGFGAARPVLAALSRRFARSYFRENGEDLCAEVRATGREITVDELLRSVVA